MAQQQSSYKKILNILADRNVTLVAVSKLQSTQKIMDLYHLGQRDFGENYVQEMVEKYEQLPKDIRWHFIGHLQSNKVKYIAPFVHLIQGVDSEKLLKEINKQAAKNNRVIDCLLQVHIAEEETKFGFSEEELHNFFTTQYISYTNVRIRGLMGMGSLSDDDEKVRDEFKSLKRLFDKYFTPSSEININYPSSYAEPGSDYQLSMGMSADYKIAIEEGSNMVRIGSLLFGKRITI